jgi:hypothetical protein
MNSWPMTDKATFKQVTYDLCKKLDREPDTREACKNDRQIAKDTLKAVGNFDNIPEDVQVFFQEPDVKSNTKVAAVKLPEQGKVPDFKNFDPRAFWICTWSLYDQFSEE